MNSLIKSSLLVNSKCSLRISASVSDRTNTGGRYQSQRNTDRTRDDASERNYRAAAGRGGGRDGQRRGGSTGRGRGLGRGQGRGSSDPHRPSFGSSSPSRAGRGSRPPTRRGRGSGRSGPQRRRYDDDSDDEEEERGDEDDGIDEGFIVIGRVDPASRSSTSQLGAAAAAVAAAGTADGVMERMGAPVSTGSGGGGGASAVAADPLDGARFWAWATGIEDIDEDEEDDEDEEGEVEEDGVEEVSPEGVLERLREMGFTLQDTQPPQPSSSAPSATTTNTASDTSTNDQQSGTPKDGTPFPAVMAAATASRRPSTSGADAALRDLRDVFLATMAAPRLPPWYLGPVEVEGGGAQRRGRAGEPDRGKGAQRTQLVAGKEQQGKEEDEQGADTTTTATTTITATTPSNRGDTSLQTTRAVAAGELLAISVPLAIRYCEHGSTPENEELAELMMMGVVGAGAGGGKGGETGRGPGRDDVTGSLMNGNLESRFSGLTDLQQSLLGMMWQGQSAAAPLTAAGKETATIASETLTAVGGQVQGRSGGGGGGGDGGGVGPVKRAFLEMVAQSAEDATAPRAPPLLPAGELYKLVNMNCLGEEFQDPALCALRRERSLGHIALWPEAAFAGHSCAPTATAYTVGDRLVVRAVTDLPKGGEVTLNWLGSLLTAPLHIRRQELQQQYGFTCGCVRCTAEARYDGTPLTTLLTSTYTTCQQLAEQLERAIAREDLGMVAEIRSRLQELQQQVEGVMRTANPRVNSKVRRWLQASIYDMYDLLSLCADELAAARGPTPSAAEVHSAPAPKSSPSRNSATRTSSIDTESLAQCCRILEATTCGSDAHTYLTAELTLRTLELFGARHEEYRQARAALVRAYGIRYGNVGPSVMEQLVAARLSAQDEADMV